MHIYNATYTVPCSLGLVYLLYVVGMLSHCVSLLPTAQKATFLFELPSIIETEVKWLVKPFNTMYIHHKLVYHHSTPNYSYK